MARFRGKSTRKTKQGVVSLAAGGLLLVTLVPTAMAATLAWGKSNIEFAAYSAHNVSRFVQGGTTYMPVWYVLQALKQSGYPYTFDGKVINISTPAGMTPNTAGIGLGSGNLTIDINGVPVKKVNSEVEVDPAGGNKTQFIPIYYIQQILGALNFYNNWDGTNWTGKPVTATMMGNSNLQVGQQDALLLTLTDSNGNAIVPSSKETWTVTSILTSAAANPGAGGSGSNPVSISGLGPTGASVDPNTGIFVATAPGTYLVTVSTAGLRVTKKIVVVGQPAVVQLTESTSTLVTDGTATDTVTVHVQDANDNPISDFNGQVTLTIPTSGGSFLGGLTSGSYNSIPVYITNGSGTVTLNAPTSNPGVTELISASDLTSLNQPVAAQVSYPSLPVSYVAPTAAAISLTPSMSAVSAASSSTSTPDYLTAALNDAAGNPLSASYGAPVYVTFKLTGPGSFDPTGTTGTNPMTAYSLYVYPGTTGVTIPVYAIANQPGTIKVTASGGGLSGSATVISELNTAASGLQVSSTQGSLAAPLSVGSTTLPVGTAFTRYTVQVVDHYGNPVPEQDNLTISDSTYNSANNPQDELFYYTASTGQPALALIGSNGSYSAQTNAATGQYQFVVLNTTPSSSPANITITDQSTQTSTTTPYIFH